MKILNKTISAGLAVMLLISTGTSVFAADAAPKEEVIYIMTDANGKTQNVYAVNIFESGNVVDYGDYSEVKMLNTNDSVKVDGDTISFKTDSEKAYLQGTMENCEIPWNIKISYLLDGNEISAEDLAGKSGILEIRFKVTKNEKCKTNFYENYALQASFALDTKLCENINAGDATVANVGSKKQLTYTILPNKGIDTSITAEVHDFEMDAVAVNGIRLNLNIEVDTGVLSDKVTELTDGIKKLDNGANDISDGAGQLKDGSSSLTDGTKQLSDGANALNIGVVKLSDGVSDVQNGLDALNEQSGNLTGGSEKILSALKTIQDSLNSVSTDTEKIEKLVTASGSIMKGIYDLKIGAQELENSVGYAQYKGIMSENGLDIDTLVAGNDQLINTLSEQIKDLQATLAQIQNIPGYEEQAAQLSAQVNMLTQIVTLLKGNNGAISGTEQYLNEVSAGISQLKNAIEKLEASYTEFNAAVGTLADSLTTMVINLSKLADGINLLTTEYATLDSGIISYTNGLSQVVSGYSQLSSGVSDLSGGSKSLLDGANDLNSGADELYGGIAELSDGTGELADGTSELREKTSDMDEQVNEEIDSILENLKGSDDIVSFVSEKNTKVQSVQFVIKTSAIEIPKKENNTEKVEEHLSFWQKLLRLFGLY